MILDGRGVSIFWVEGGQSRSSFSRIVAPPSAVASTISFTTSSLAIVHSLSRSRRPFSFSDFIFGGSAKKNLSLSKLVLVDATLQEVLL